MARVHVTSLVNKSIGPVDY